MFCREQTLVATGSFGGAATPIKCKSWLCPNCVEMRKRQLMARACQGKPNRFITITCRRGVFPTKERAAIAIAKAWRTIVQRWRRQAKWHKCEYLCVFEPHKSGWPHLHVLWRGHWIDQKWLSQQMTIILNSPHVHISRIKDEKSAVGYVTKYFSKAPERFGTAKRYWASANYAKSKLTDAERVFPKTWLFDRENQPIQSIAEDWKRYHRTIWTMPPDIIAWGSWYEPDMQSRAPPGKIYRVHAGVGGFVYKREKKKKERKRLA